MKKIIYLIIVFFAAGSIYSDEIKLTEKKIFNDKLTVLTGNSWEEDSFNLDIVKTVQFSNSDKSIQISYAIEELNSRNFKQYLKFRYDAAKSNFWKIIKEQKKLQLNYEHDYKIYTYNKEGKSKNNFKKMVICINGIKNYYTVTIMLKNEYYYDKFEEINRILIGMKINN